jgi:NAD(P)-dependent dehydrogenase (short-subunit alcohol dehydrogenase family)
MQHSKALQSLPIIQNMSSKTLLLITGANQGLGYYAAQQLAATGSYHVLLGSRDINKAHKAIDSLSKDESVKVSASDFSPVEIDVNNDASITAAAKHVTEKFGKLDALLNNAGIAQAQEANTDGSGPSLRELYRSHYETNVFGVAVVTDAFLPLLRKGSAKRLAFTSSGLASLELAAKPGTLYSATNYPIYRSTKSALNMIMLHYALSLESEGFVVSAADPGYCATSLNGNSGFKDPRDGAKELVKSLVGEKKDVHAVMVSDAGPVPW